MARTVTASTTPMSPIQPITPPSLPTPLPLSPSSGAAITYAVWDGEEVPDTLLSISLNLARCNNYGIWGSNVPKRQGKPVKLNGAPLRAQCLSNPAQTVLLIGHVFATVWDVTEVGSVGWITQLVVRKEDRKHWVATHLLQTLKSNHRFSEIAALGLVSSHPAACTALAKCANYSLWD
ncbi:hypothetical protein M378DRAFT_18856 [Amanita muscaria Koide BX008]|uniref:Uncharacterized protein n=1 Tax=Amanita muscaria (strain Koide BX008) TaxID=946122 RepID=A0A0C2SKL5_AMAMK|nr:hypothetical protein M378DRAFT_18856 [Amanita muscaria Koide BX008]